MVATPIPSRTIQRAFSFWLFIALWFPVIFVILMYAAGFLGAALPEYLPVSLMAIPMFTIFPGCLLLSMVGWIKWRHGVAPEEKLLIQMILGLVGVFLGLSLLISIAITIAFMTLLPVWLSGPPGA